MLLQEARFQGIPEGSREWFEIQREIIQSRPLIKRCYDIWYRRLLKDVESVPVRDGHLVELGSGGSYFKELCPGLITSDVVDGIAEKVIDARRLPFKDTSVRAIFFTHAFHHIPDVELFLSEANRVLVPGGVISMIEVAHTPFSRFFFKRFHPEPYDDSVETWAFDQQNALLDSNQALSWNVFIRDREQFETTFPDLEILQPTYLPWIGYLISGGVTRRNLIPGFLSPLVALADLLLRPLNSLMSLHWHITVQKKRTPEYR